MGLKGWGTKGRPADDPAIQLHQALSEANSSIPTRATEGQTLDGNLTLPTCGVTTEGRACRTPGSAGDSPMDREREDLLQSPDPDQGNRLPLPVEEVHNGNANLRDLDHLRAPGRGIQGVMGVSHRYLLDTPNLQELAGNQTDHEGTPSMPIKGTKERLHLIQLNMHHAKLPTYELFPTISNDTLACVQEPWIVKGHPKGLLQHIRAIYAIEPKAAIICHKDMNIVPLPHLTTPLMATGMLHTTQGNRTFPKILISSWYWPPQAPMPAEFGTLVDHIRLTRPAFIILGDMNAHSTWWGHADTDRRGREMEEIIMAIQATILNRANVQTFQGARGSSAIDVSLVSTEVADLDPQWHCGRRVSHSDHLRIDIV